MFQALAGMATMRALLEAAERESAAMGEAEPGAEHVAVAALTMPDRTAADTLAELGADAAQLREAIEQVHAEALAGVGINHGQPPTPIPTSRGIYRAKGSTRDLLTATAAARKALRDRHFTSAHVLIGACELQRGTLPQALQRLGLDLDALRAAAERHANPRR